MKPGELIHTLGDAHLYHNHFVQARLQLLRKPRKLPKMRLNKDHILSDHNVQLDLFEERRNIISDIVFDKVKINTFSVEDFKLTNYNPHPNIKAKVAV